MDINMRVFLQIAFQVLSLPLRVWYYLFIKLLSLKKVKLIEIKLEGKMSEAPLTSGIMSILKPTENRFYLKILELVILDDLLSLPKSRLKKELKEILVVIHNPKLGWSKAWELNQLLGSLSQKVEVKVFLDSADALDYYVALGAKEIYASPAMSLQLTGLETSSLFFDSLFKKLNIRANFIQIGNYKSAGEKYTRKNFSERSKKQLQELLKDFQKEFGDALKKSRNRHLKVSSLTAIQKQALISSQEAFKAGLLDGVLYLNELRLIIQREHDLKTTSFSSLEKAISKAQKKQKKIFSLIKRKKVAFLVGEGVILDSEEPNPKAISYLDYQETLKDLQEKSQYDAYILRWNSPGGSALVSDLLWSEIMRLKTKRNAHDDPWVRLSKKYQSLLSREPKKSAKKDAKKKKLSKEKSPPIFVSQSDVAASGGYYLSAVSNHVYSSPMSITGSIGVIMGKFNIAGALKKIGVNIDRVKVGEQSDIFSGFSNFSPQQVQLIKKNMNSMYDLFAERIHQGRSMPIATIKKLGEGKIYSGRKAKALGLVDHLGGLRDIFRDLKKNLDLTEEDELVVNFYPKIKAPLFQKFDQLSPLLQDFKTVEYLLHEKVLFFLPMFF